MGNTNPKKPVHEVRMGRVRAAIWENATKNGSMHNVTLTRLYKDDNDDWADSTSFGRDDLPLLAKVADQAHSWIFSQNGRTTMTKVRFVDRFESPQRWWLLSVFQFGFPTASHHPILVVTIPSSQTKNHFNLIAVVATAVVVSAAGRKGFQWH